MNQKVEQALIDYSNDVWDRAMNAGALAEQERIIKLLEDERIDWHCDQCLGESLFDLGYENGWVKEKLIALIKGEK